MCRSGIYLADTLGLAASAAPAAVTSARMPHEAEGGGMVMKGVVGVQDRSGGGEGTTEGRLTGMLGLLVKDGGKGGFEWGEKGCRMC